MDGVTWLTVLLAVVILLGAANELSRLSRSLRDAALGSDPVYSAETTDGHEAEYIDDRLPSKMAKRLLLGLVAFGCACGVLAGLWYGLASR